MKMQELKSKIKTEEFETVCLLVYESIVENKITPEQFTELVEDITKEFDSTLDDDDDFNESYIDDFDINDNFDDEYNDDY